MIALTQIKNNEVHIHTCSRFQFIEPEHLIYKQKRQ